MGPPQEICPNWPNLTVDEREHFWVWTIASIAWKESTCNAKSRNGNATNGVAVGLLQLDEKPKARSWRGKNCSVKTVTDPQNNIKCGLDILQEILKQTKGTIVLMDFYTAKRIILIGNNCAVKMVEKLESSFALIHYVLEIRLYHNLTASI